QRRTPRLTAGRRRAHLLKISEVDNVELGIAVAEERAALGAVARRPVLVVEQAIRADGDRNRPGHTAVGRTAYDNIDHIDRRAIWRDPEERDQPDVVLCVERH